MKYEYKLWKAKASDATVRFVHIDDLPTSGFVSVYCFTKDDADAMQAAGIFAGFKGVVYSPQLYVDCDTQEASEATERWLVEKEVAYEKYTTGNRGHHYHIDRIGVPNHLMPYSDKLFVSEVFGDADTSIYHHVALWRAVGATHNKTGLEKELLYRVEGKGLLVAGEIPEALNSDPEEAHVELQCVFQDRVLASLTVPHFEGDRHRRYVDMGLALHRLDQPYDYAYAYMANAVLMCEKPLTELEITRILDWVYYKRSY